MQQWSGRKRAARTEGGTGRARQPIDRREPNHAGGLQGSPLLPGSQ